MKGWILYPRYVSLHTDNAFDWMRSEARAHGIELEVLFFEDIALLCSREGNVLLLKGEPAVDYPDFVIFRGYDSLLAMHFEARGIPVVNSSASAAASKDKLLTCQLLAAEGIAIPATVGGVAEEWRYERLSTMLGERFVVKRRDGAKGEDVYLIGNESEMNEAVANCRGNCIAQRFIEESCGRDIRVWVIGGHAVACVMRYSHESFRSNYSLGGNVAPYPLTDEVREIAERSTRVLGLEFAGVDLLLGNEGLVVCEINANAGFRTLSEVGENNIPSRLFDYISRKYGSHKYLRDL